MMNKLGRTVVGRDGISCPFVALSLGFKTSSYQSTFGFNYMKSLSLVPRAGIEPARSFAGNPRILSPVTKTRNYIEFPCKFQTWGIVWSDCGRTPMLGVARHGLRFKPISSPIFSTHEARKITSRMATLFASLTSARGRYINGKAIRRHNEVGSGLVPPIITKNENGVGLPVLQV